MTDTPFPLQPIKDGHFVENAIVRRLLDEGPFDMNAIARWDVSEQDRMQFAQLIGYTLDGITGLDYFDDETYEAAHLTAEGGVGEEQARLASLRDTLDGIRVGLRAASCAAFKIHPDDLTT